MSKLRVRVGGEWIEVDPDDVELVVDEAELGEVVDGEVVMEPVSSLPTAADRRREMLRGEAQWVDE